MFGIERIRFQGSIFMWQPLQKVDKFHSINSLFTLHVINIKYLIYKAISGVYGGHEISMNKNYPK